MSERIKPYGFLTHKKAIQPLIKEYLRLKQLAGVSVALECLMQIVLAEEREAKYEEIDKHLSKLQQREN